MDVEVKFDHESYMLFHSEYIAMNKKEIISLCDASKVKISNLRLGDNNIIDNNANLLTSKFTDEYLNYNIFSVFGPNKLSQNVFCQIKSAIRVYCDRKKIYSDGLFIQAWMNHHNESEVLDWHSHEGYICHGYVSIEPKVSITEFMDFNIINKIGQIYIGECELKHRVVCLDSEGGNRITIGFDVIGCIDVEVENMGFIPL